MSDEQDAGGVRRFGRKDRKRSLDPRGPLFPPDEPIAETNSAADEPESPEVEAPTDEPAAPPPTANDQSPIVRPAPPQRPVRTEPSGGKQIVANLLTVVFLLGTIGLIGLVAIITSNPNTPLNPFPPFTPPPIVITATFLPPTETPEGTAAPTATFTPVALEAASAAPAQFRFALASEQPVYAPNANDKGCNWSSIAGTVTDGKGTALDGYRVHVKGNGVDETVFSGATLTFGAGGFELFLNGTPQAQSYTVQLSDPQNRPLSAEYTVATKASCDQNVAVLQFIQQP
jgi:hypothetical protein